MSFKVITEEGQVVGEINEGDRILRKESIEHLVNYQDWRIKNFFKGHAAEITKVMKKLSTNEKAFLFAIACYVGYEDCCLRYSNGKDITTEDLIELTGLGRSTVFETINSLVKKDIIYKGKNSKNRQYFVNPWLFCKGNRINKVLKTMFKNYKVRVCNGIQWKNLKDR